MNDVRLLAPTVGTAHELAVFQRLIREGFEGSDASLPARIGMAHRLAFCRADGGPVIGIAALKAPGTAYVEEVFAKAAADADARTYGLELGWVFVVPGHRGRQIGETLCRRLLADASPRGVFATTRPSNAFMIKILDAAGFKSVGRPYRHIRRDEELALFVRPGLGSRSEPRS